MKTKNIITGMWLFSVISLLSCNPPRTLYLSNKTSKAITLVVDSTVKFDKQSPVALFKDSLDGRRIEAGHSIINYGKGNWSKYDQKTLEHMLLNTNIFIEGSEESHRLPDNFRVKHYGLFVDELLVKFRDIK